AVSMGTGPAGVAVVGGRRCGEGLALRWCISAALCAAFLGLGTSIAVLGPTFQNLADNVHKNVTDIYYIFVGRSLGYLGGSVVGGILFDHVNAHLLLGECGSGGGHGQRALPVPFICSCYTYLTALFVLFPVLYSMLQITCKVPSLQLADPCVSGKGRVDYV
uniref:Uncharacterized protein n=1 Tax=Pavo cristatus TaxID=9049 RepID=A0A8C9F1Z7_PAVCR